MANSSIFSLPNVTAPASFKRATTVASNGLMYCARIFEPAVVAKSRVTNTSLCAIGRPVNAPAWPAAMVASAARAWASVTAGSRRIKAFSSACASARSKKCCANSTAEICLLSSCARSSRRDKVCNINYPVSVFAEQSKCVGLASCLFYSMTFGTRNSP